MADGYDRSPTFLNIEANKMDNVPRHSRREKSLERSRLPTYRRSKSAINITGSLLKEKQCARGRSSSANRPQRLFSGSTYVLSQQLSSSAYHNKFSTPMNQQLLRPSGARQHLLRPSGASSRSTGSKLSPWQKTSCSKEEQKKGMAKEFNRVRQVLASINCDIQLKKPVPLRDFVDILIHIFNAMNYESELMFSNYLTVVPIIMKTLNYTGNCSMSMLKTVNVMHSWPHVLGLLAYLCDAIEAQNNTEPYIKGPNHIANIFRKIVCKLVTQTNDTKKQELYAQFAHETLLHYGIDVQNLDQKKSEQAALLRSIDFEQERVNKLKIEYNARKNKEEDLENQLRAIIDLEEQSERDYQENMAIMTAEMKDIDAQIAEAADTELLMTAQLEKQRYSKNDMAQLQEEIRDLEETCQLQGRRNEKMDVEWNQISLEQSQVQGKLKAVAIEFNADLKEMSTNRPELMDNLVPESGFSKYTKEGMDLILSSCLISFKNVYESISDLQKILSESELKYEKYIFDLEDCKRDITRSTNKKNHQMELRKREKREFDRKTEELQNKLQDKRGLTLSLLDKKERLQVDLKEHTQLSLKLDDKIAEMDCIYKKNRENADEALSKALFVTSTFMQKIEEEYKKFVDSKNEYQNKMDDLKKHAWAD